MIVIGTHPQDDYPATFAALRDKVARGECGTVHQVCQMLELECLEKLAQEAVDQWTFESGTEEDRNTLEIIEIWLKVKREGNNVTGAIH